jgi:phospholipid transport system substrate-binding protein
MRNATSTIGVPCTSCAPWNGFAPALQLWCGIVVVPRGESLVMQRAVRFSFIVIVALICLSPRSGEAANGTPSDVVRHFYDVLLDVMKNAAALGPKGRYQKLEPVVPVTFDVPFMTRLAVGPLWAKLTPEQKQRAAKAFARYITATYANQFDDYSGERFEILGEQPIKHATIVKTQIVQSNGDKNTINYALHDNDTAWQVRDVYLQGTISELATRRSDFATTLRSGGIEALIDQLNKKADDLVS